MGALIRHRKAPISCKEIGPDFLKKSGSRWIVSVTPDIARV